MKKGKIAASLTLAVLLCGLLHAAEVDWKDGISPPSAWTLTPSNPTGSSVISFSGPLDINSYGNSCAAEASLGGTPQLTVDSFNRVVQLWFQGPAPTQCILIYKPVCGLEGTFGPLTEGKWTFRCLPLGVEIEFIVGGATGNIIYVDQAALGPVDGTSWHRAFRNVQDALATAAAGDEIRVARGTYTPDVGGGQSAGDRGASFGIPEGVTLRGGYAGYWAINPNARATKGHPTILSGDLNGDDLWGILNRDDNSHQVVTVGVDATLDGLTISDGQADGAFPNHYGGGVYIPAGSPIFRDCTIRANTAVYGGGVAALAAEPYFANCSISGNRALIFGGGLYSHDSRTGLANCLMTGNSAGSDTLGGGSAICNMGGDAAHVSLSNSTLADNVGPGHDEWVIFNFNYFSTFMPLAETVSIHNSIVYNAGGAAVIWSSNPSNVGASFSLIQGGWAGLGNLNADPRFVTRGLWSIEGEWIDAGADYSLQATSPAIDGGNNTLIPSDQADVDDDGNVVEDHPLDLANAARVQNAIVDMGAYESAGAGPGPGPGPGPAWVELRTFSITFDVPMSAPSSVSLNGAYSHEVETNFAAELKLEVTATSAAGGNWTAWFNPDPGVVGPGSTNVSWNVRGENVAVGLLTPGAMDVEVAEVKIYVRPATP